MTGRHIVKDGVWLVPYVEPTKKELQARERRLQLERFERRKAYQQFMQAINLALYGQPASRYHHGWRVWTTVGIFDTLGRYCVMACENFTEVAPSIYPYDYQAHHGLYSDQTRFF